MAQCTDFLLLVGVEVGLTGPKIQPDPVIVSRGSKLSFTDEFQEGRDNGKFFIGGDIVKGSGVDTVDPCKLVRPACFTQEFPDIHDVVTFDGDMGFVSEGT